MMMASSPSHLVGVTLLGVLVGLVVVELLEQLVEVAEGGDVGLVGRQDDPLVTDERDDLVGLVGAPWPARTPRRA